ncbi:MAG: aminotransferase class V-fold PLP-dependent enzyme [Chloroflexota bacterium]
MSGWHTPDGQIDPLKVRAAYPILSTKPGGRPLHYLDSAATAQRPKRVIDAVSEFLLTANANPHRGAYTLGSMATDAYESARTRTATFLGVPAAELVMLGSATEALNLVARSWGKANLSRGDVVLVTEAEHHANLIPWQQVTREADADLEFIPVDDVTGEILWDRLDGLLKLRPKIVALGHVSNVLGSIAPLAQIAPQVHSVGGLLVVDGCQAVANIPVDILETGADFYAFSAHKMGGLFSGGGLWARANLLDAMAPIETGGDMIREVRLRDATFAEGTQRFEAGTPDASGTVALAAACDFLDELGRQKIHDHEVRMLERVLRELPDALPDVRILGSKIAKDRAGLVSFSSDLVHAHDLATILDRRGVAIRAGHHCAMPLHEQLELSATARVSVAPYTTDHDLDALFEGLRDARKIFER